MSDDIACNTEKVNIMFKLSYNLITKLPWRRQQKTSRSSSQADICQLLQCLSIFTVFGLTQPGIKLRSTVSVAGVVSRPPRQTRPFQASVTSRTVVRSHSSEYTVVEMATAQRTRPRAVVDAPRRAAWQLKSALRHSITASAQRCVQ